MHRGGTRGAGRLVTQPFRKPPTYGRGSWALFWGALCVLGVAMLPLPAQAAGRGQGPPKLRSAAVRVQLLDDVDGHLPAPWLVHGVTGRHAIASISKLLAAMVVLDRGLDPDGQTEILKSDHRFTRGGARSRLRVGYTYRNGDLLTAALMSSDNRATLALGRAVGLKRRAFARAMEEKARAVGLRRMQFEEPTGISHDNQASPEGVVLVLRAALEYEAIRTATTTTTTVIRPAGRRRPAERYVNTNRLVRWGYRGVLGGKTGFNSAAGHCLTFALKLRDGRRLGIVILGAPSRRTLFADAKKLVKWVRAEARRRP